MPAPLWEDARKYLQAQGAPISTYNLNNAMEELRNDPSLRPSYSSDNQMLSAMGGVTGQPDTSKVYRGPPPKGIGASGGNDAVMYDPMYNPRPNSATDTKRKQRYSTNEDEFGQTGSDYSQTTPARAKQVRQAAKDMADRDLRSGRGGTAQGASPGSPSQSVSTESIKQTELAPPKAQAPAPTDPTRAEVNSVSTATPARRRPPGRTQAEQRTDRTDLEANIAQDRPTPAPPPAPAQVAAAPAPSVPAAPVPTDPMESLGQAFFRRAAGANQRWADRFGLGSQGVNSAVAAPAVPAPAPAAPVPGSTPSFMESLANPGNPFPFTPQDIGNLITGGGPPGPGATPQAQARLAAGMNNPAVGQSSQPIAMPPGVAPPPMGIGDQAPIPGPPLPVTPLPHPVSRPPTPVPQVSLPSVPPQVPPDISSFLSAIPTPQQMQAAQAVGTGRAGTPRLPPTPGKGMTLEDARGAKPLTKHRKSSTGGRARANQGRGS